jgi:hypothetical protein
MREKVTQKWEIILMKILLIYMEKGISYLLFIFLNDDGCRIKEMRIYI